MIADDNLLIPEISVLNVPNRARNDSAVGEFWGAAEILNRRRGEDVQGSNKDHARQHRYNRFFDYIAWSDRPFFNLPVSQHAIRRARKTTRPETQFLCQTAFQSGPDTYASVYFSSFIEPIT